MRKLLFLSLVVASCGGGDVDAPEGDFGADANWRMYGHDHHNTRSNTVEDTLGVDNVENLVLLWEHVGVEVTSTPAVIDDIVYFSDWDGKVYAKRATDGEEVWTVDAGVGGLLPSLAVTEDQIFIGGGPAMINALDLETGEVQWSVQLDDHPYAGIQSSCVAVGDIILVGVSSGEIGALTDDYTFRGSIVALAQSDGSELWRVYVTQDDETAGAGVSVWSSAAVDEERELMFIGTGNTYEEPASPMSDAIVAVDYTTGEVAWVSQFTEGDVYTLFQEQPQGPDADIGAHPNLFVVNGRHAVGAGDKAGVYAALDRDTGETLWATDLGPGSHLGGVMTAAAYHDGKIFVAQNAWPDGFDTEEVWIPDFSNPVNSSEMISLDANTGEVLWRTMLEDPSIGGITYANGVVYAGHTLGMQRAFDAETGDILWEDQAGNSLASGNSVSNGRLFVSHGFRFIGLTPGVPGEEGGVRVYGLPE